MQKLVALKAFEGTNFCFSSQLAQYERTLHPENDFQNQSREANMQAFQQLQSILPSLRMF